MEIANPAPPHIISWSKKFLTDRHVLDFFVPVSEREIRLDSRDYRDLIDVIINSQEEILNQQTEHGREIHQSSVWSCIMTPLYPLMRITHIALATLVVAPVGVAFHLFQAAYNFSFHDFMSDRGVANIAKQHFKAMKGDAVALLSRTFCVRLLIYGIGNFLTVSTFVQGTTFVALCVAFIAIALFAFGTCDSSDIIATLVAPEEEGTALYMALELRRRLGIVGTDGDLLSPQIIRLDSDDSKHRKSELSNRLSVLIEAFSENKKEIRHRGNDARHKLAGENFNIIRKMGIESERLAHCHEANTACACIHLLMIIFI